MPSPDHPAAYTLRPASARHAPSIAALVDDAYRRRVSAPAP